MHGGRKRSCFGVTHLGLMPSTVSYCVILFLNLFSSELLQFHYLQNGNDNLSFRESLWRLKIVYRKYIENCKYSKMITTFLGFLLIWVQNSANSFSLVELQNWLKEINSTSQNLLISESNLKAIVFWTQKKCYGLSRAALFNVVAASHYLNIIKIK